jgi:hypothetical protein
MHLQGGLLDADPLCTVGLCGPLFYLSQCGQEYASVCICGGWHRYAARLQSGRTVPMLLCGNRGAGCIVTPCECSGMVLFLSCRAKDTIHAALWTFDCWMSCHPLRVLGHSFVSGDVLPLTLC